MQFISKTELKQLRQDEKDKDTTLYQRQQQSHTHHPETSPPPKTTLWERLHNDKTSKGIDLREKTRVSMYFVVESFLFSASLLFYCKQQPVNAAFNFLKCEI
jgi:hypothetical protein